MEDSEQRQLPGNARAADRWSAGSTGPEGMSEGCGLPDCQQAVADWRVNRAQPRSRASGVSCTAWFGGTRSCVIPNRLGNSAGCNRSGGAAEVGFSPPPGGISHAVHGSLAARHASNLANRVEVQLQSGCLSALYRTP